MSYALEEDRQKIMEFKGMIIDALRRSKRTGKEHGFKVCKEDGKLVATPMCSGTECEVSLKECEWNRTFMEFHTHPSSHGGYIPSIEDLVGAITDNVNFFCIGNRFNKGQAQCYKFNPDDPAFKEFLDTWKDYRYNGAPRREELNKIIVRSILGDNRMLEVVARWKHLLG